MLEAFDNPSNEVISLKDTSKTKSLENMLISGTSASFYMEMITKMHSQHIDNRNCQMPENEKVYTLELVNTLKKPKL